jgi:uncharacterized protein YkwD
MIRASRLTRVCAALAIGLWGCAPSSPSSDTVPVGSPSSASSVARAITDLINAERSGAGLAPLEEDARLARAAQTHADQMARAGRMEHDLDGAEYPRLEDRLGAVQYDWQVTGENLAFGQDAAAAVVRDWMRSPAHRGNVLNPAFVETGVGHANDAAGRRFFAQVFARPR